MNSYTFIFKIFVEYVLLLNAPCNFIWVSLWPVRALDLFVTIYCVRELDWVSMTSLVVNALLPVFQAKLSQFSRHFSAIRMSPCWRQITNYRPKTIWVNIPMLSTIGKYEKACLQSTPLPLSVAWENLSNFWGGVKQIPHAFLKASLFSL